MTDKKLLCTGATDVALVVAVLAYGLVRRRKRDEL